MDRPTRPPSHPPYSYSYSFLFFSFSLSFSFLQLFFYLSEHQLFKPDHNTNAQSLLLKPSIKLQTINNRSSLTYVNKNSICKPLEPYRFNPFNLPQGTTSHLTSVYVFVLHGERAAAVLQAVFFDPHTQKPV